MAVGLAWGPAGLPEKGVPSKVRKTLDGYIRMMEKKMETTF